MGINKFTVQNPHIVVVADLAATTPTSLKDLITNHLTTNVAALFGAGSSGTDALQDFLSALSWRVRSGYIGHDDGGQTASVYILTDFGAYPGFAITHANVLAHGIPIAQNTTRPYHCGYGQADQVLLSCAGAVGVSLDLVLET